MSRLFYIIVLFVAACSAVVQGESSYESEEEFNSEIEYNDESEIDNGYSHCERNKPTPKPLNCGINEVEACLYRCPPEKTCRNRNIAFRCARDPNPCQKKCVCKSGYYKNSIGQCVTKAQCEKCSKPNEFFSCGSACDNECKNIQFQNRTNCPIINKKCNEKCYCDDGYARDDKGNCIPVDKCKPTPKPLNCGIQEVEACLYRCPPEKTCRNRNIAFRCARDPNPCQKKCVCKSGYYKNSIGQCVTKAQCEKCSKPNEFFSCGSACDNECKNIQFQNRTNCPIINIKCNEKCYCDDGYARDDKGNCIPVDKCKKPVCPPNEVYVKEKRTCLGDSCSSLYSKKDCSKEPPGKPGCECKNGFRRLGDTCVPTCMCTNSCNPQNTCNGPNEEFVQEKSTCPGDTCNALVIRVDCTNAPPPQPGCTCKSGYFRKFNETSPCVPICECPQMASSVQCAPGSSCSDPNEEYVLGKSCPPDLCESIVARYKCDSNEVDQYRCRCKSGFLRVRKGSSCVPICQCPELANSPDCK